MTANYLKLINKIILHLTIFMLLICSFTKITYAQNSVLLNKSEKKIAYLEKGAFWLYDKSYVALKEALIAQNEKKELAQKDSLPKFVNFTYTYPANLHLSPGWNTGKEEIIANALTLLHSDADIIIAAGTAAVNTLVSLMRSERNIPLKPVIGIALADPVASGFITEDGEPIHPFFTTEVYPDRWQSMYRVFHDVINFKKLGVMYPSTNDGRIFAAVDDAYRIAEKQGFKIVEAVIPDESQDSCMQGIEKLKNLGADAFFISPLICFDWSVVDPSPLLELAHNYQMPTFARDGSLFVQGGALMGFATWDFTPSAQRLAKAIEDIILGKEPREIRMIITAEPKIAINLEVANRLKLVFPFNLLLSADQIYEETSRPRME